MKADPKADAAPPKSSKKMLIIIVAAVLVLGGGGAAAFFMMSGKPDAKDAKEVKEYVKPEYVALEPFTVNLQPEDGEQYLQVTFTLQTTSVEQVTVIKDNMARVRSRILLLLSTKKASELITAEGKAQLSREIIAEVEKPFFDKGPKQEVTDVLPTSFIIQ